MEKIILTESEQAMLELAEFIENLKLPDPEFSAVYDPHTGEVKSVGPTDAFADEQYKIQIDFDTAIDIIEGRIRITSCFIDPDSTELEIVEVKHVFKIDDVLHRVPNVVWSDVARPDIFITYLHKSKKLKFQLSEEFYGTKKIPKKFHPIKPKKTRWAGETGLIFLVTAYNDPHAIFEVINFTIDDLIENTKVYTNINVPERFSIFTRRIFKNYVMDIK